MKSILEEFANGNLNPNDRDYSNNPEYARILHQLVKKEKE